LRERHVPNAMATELERRRQERGWSYRQLAQQVEAVTGKRYHRNYLNFVCTGKRFGSQEMLLAVGTTLGLTEDQIRILDGLTPRQAAPLATAPGHPRGTPRTPRGTPPDEDPDP